MFSFCLRQHWKGRGLGGTTFFFYSFEDLRLHLWKWVMHNCHRVPLAGTQSASRFLGWRSWFQGRCCPALVAAGWEALCSATLVIPTMTVKKGKREGNALNTLKGMNVVWNSLEINFSESLKCNTLASGKFCQLLERRGWFWLLSSAHPCTGRGFLSPGACTLGVIVAASSVLISEITGGTGTDVLILSKGCTICSGQGNGAQTTTAQECLRLGVSGCTHSFSMQLSGTSMKNHPVTSL